MRLLKTNFMMVVMMQPMAATYTMPRLKLGHGSNQDDAILDVVHEATGDQFHNGGHDAANEAETMIEAETGMKAEIGMGALIELVTLIKAETIMEEEVGMETGTNGHIVIESVIEVEAVTDAQAATNADIDPEEEKVEACTDIGIVASIGADIEVEVKKGSDNPLVQALRQEQSKGLSHALPHPLVQTLRQWHGLMMNVVVIMCPKQIQRRIAQQNHSQAR